MVQFRLPAPFLLCRISKPFDSSRVIVWLSRPYQPYAIKGLTMTQTPSDKYTIAWFKLAEFVRNKEKERALGVYRLLVHSLSDEAFAAQLEGDLLLAFHDDKARESYIRAACLYEQEGKLTQAVAIYEHLLTLEPESFEYLVKVVQLYDHMKSEIKVVRCLASLVRLLLKRGCIEQAHTSIEECRVPDTRKILLHEQFVIGILAYPNYDKVLLDYHMTIVLDARKTEPSLQNLTLFLSHIAHLNPTVYATACAALQQSARLA